MIGLPGLFASTSTLPLTFLTVAATVPSGPSASAAVAHAQDTTSHAVAKNKLRCFIECSLVRNEWIHRRTEPRRRTAVDAEVVYIRFRLWTRNLARFGRFSSQRHKRHGPFPEN